MLRLLGLARLSGLTLRLGVYPAADVIGPSVMSGDDDEAMYADDLEYLEVYT